MDAPPFFIAYGDKKRAEREGAQKELRARPFASLTLSPAMCVNAKPDRRTLSNIDNMQQSSIRYNK